MSTQCSLFAGKRRSWAGSCEGREQRATPPGSLRGPEMRRLPRALLRASACPPRRCDAALRWKGAPETCQASLLHAPSR